MRPGAYVCVSVTDTGIGMSQETIEKAFEPFFTTKPIGQGTGLGLSMIYGFVRQSEGYTKISSAVGAWNIAKTVSSRATAATCRRRSAARCRPGGAAGLAMAKRYL